MPLTREQATELATVLLATDTPAPSLIQWLLSQGDQELVLLLEHYTRVAELNHHDSERLIRQAIDARQDALRYTKAGLVLGRALQANLKEPASCHAPSSPPSSAE